MASKKSKTKANKAAKTGDLNKNKNKNKKSKAKAAKTGDLNKNKKVEQVINARIITRPCRSSYMFVNEPRENDDGDEVYSSMILVRKKDSVTLDRIRAATLIAAKKKFGEKVKLGQLRLPLRDANEEERTGDEFKNTFFLNCKSYRKPGVVDRSNNKVIGGECQELFYSGGYYMFSLTFVGYDSNGNKGVSARLNNIMFHKHADRLDGGLDAEDEFVDYADDDD